MFVVDSNNKDVSEHRDITTKGTKSLKKLYPCKVATSNNRGSNNRGNGLFTSIFPVNLKLITIKNDTPHCGECSGDTATVAWLLGLHWQHCEAECGTYLTLT